MPSGRGLRKAISGTVVGVVTITLSTLAVLYPGFATADVSLNDGGVWVTRSADLMVGHLNYPSHALDSGLHSTVASFALFQDGKDVMMYDQASGALVRIDPAKVITADSGALSPNSRVDSRHGVIGIVDGQTNGLFAAKFSQLQGLSVAGRDPIADLGPGGAVAVSTQGTIFAVSAEKHQLITVVDSDTAPVVRDLAKFGAQPALSITAVGEVPVVLDSANGVVYTPDRTITVPEAKLGVLQAAGAANDAVIIAGTGGLISQPLDGSKDRITNVAPGGAPAQPYWLAGCAYGVWSNTGNYVRDCPGDVDDRNEMVPAVVAQPQLALRQNRSVIVINELNQGTLWMVNESMLQVNNWQDVIPPESQEGQEDSKDKKNQFKLPDRTPKNHKPDAVNDHLAARPGSTTTLDVEQNDTDPDGDLLAASPVGPLPADVNVQPIRDGAALQVTLGKNVSGTVSFRYQVNDGREGGTDEATVTLDVHPQASNAAPTQAAPKTMQIEAGAKASFDALQGWKDPDGDQLYLKSATSTDEQVTFRNNGMVQVSESTKETRRQEIKLVVSDGTDETEGVLQLDVQPRKSLPPIANSDRVSTLVGQAITVSPLVNDGSPSGGQLVLAKVPQVAGANVVMDSASGNFTFSSAVPNTYYVPYLVTDGTNASSALVRIDVKAAAQDGLAPLAAQDTALLPTSRDALVAVLDNDTDPTGGILVVQSVTVPQGARVSAEVLEHRVVRVTDDGGLGAPVTLTYQVSNGTRTATGEIKVIPVKLPEKSNPPATMPDQAVVRAGDVVTMNVLGNDYHPDGDKMTLLPNLLETPDPAVGVAFVSEGKVRFKAGPTPGQVDFVYQVKDTHQNISAARVHLEIVASDGSNSAPKPQAVTARAIAGTSVRIPIPLDGIDPDGDSVELVGTGTAAAKGQVSVGNSWLVYKAYAGASGRDSFTYVVRDRFGAVATGSVVVGIVLPSSMNQAPYTVRDEVTVKPGRVVSVPVLSNDSDPDGDDLSLASQGLTAEPGVDAKAVKGRVVVQAPTTPKTYAITYNASDTFGAKTPGVIGLNVTPNAPLKPPVARDDRVMPVDIVGKSSVIAPVLVNDEDPDGTTDDFTVSTDSPNAVVRTDKSLEVKLTPEDQVILYTVVDKDKQAASAVLFVPGTDSMLPTLKSTTPVQVVSGHQLKLALADHVVVRAGHTPRVAEAESARAGNANGDPLVVDANTVQYTSATDWYGLDSVSVMVTDGADINDSEGKTAYLSIPIQVIPATNQSPKLAGASVQVTPGEPAVELNVRKLVTDPDPGDVEKASFEVTNVPAGFRASIDGDTLKISADSGTSQGTVATVAIKADDHTSAPATGEVSVTVVPSQRPLPVAVDDVVDTAFQGQPTTVPVLDNDLPNPFPDVPLQVLDATVISGSGKAEVVGANVVVTPDAAFVGTMQVRYRIQDATKSVERQAQATISVTVQGRPDAPVRPSVDSVADRKAVLSWPQPSPNGRQITSYTVESKAHNYKQVCPTTQCTLTNLTNDVEYTFTVVATNEVGDSDPSPPSAIARPDVRPDRPAAPQLVFGDKSLTVTWVTPHSSGSAVTSYNLQISPAPDGGPMNVSVTGNSYTWAGLTNGVAYRVQVQALNRLGDGAPSQWSAFSREETPAAVPDAPGKPSVTVAPGVGTEAQVTATWDPPVNNNGDAVDYYTVTSSGGDGKARSVKVVASPTPKAVIGVGVSGSGYTFMVTAHNKAGDSAKSPASDPVRAANAPAAPTNVQIEATGVASQVKVTITPGDWNGNAPSEVTWHWSGTGGSGTVSVQSATASKVVGLINGVSNGVAVTVKISGTSKVSGRTGGTTSSEGSATPYGKPIVDCRGFESRDGAVLIKWHVDSNGRPLNSQSPKSVNSSGDASQLVDGLSGGATGGVDLSYGNPAGTTTGRCEGQANNPTASITGFSGKTATLTVHSWTAETKTVRCWAAQTYADHNWKANGYNYGGEVANVSIPANGSVSITCPDGKGILTSGKPFSIEILNASVQGWVGWITIP